MQTQNPLLNQAPPVQIPKLVIKKPTDYINVTSTVILIYGQPGARKSTFAMTAPNAIMFDFDGGVRRVAEAYRCEYVPNEYLRDWETVEASITDPQFAIYDTFIFDSVTKLMDYLTDFIIKKDPKAKKGGGGLSMTGYGTLGATFLAFLKKIEMMNKNIVFVAHDKEGKEGDANRLRPDIVGGSLGYVTRSADMIGYVEMIDNVSIVQFSPRDRFYAKNSCGLPPQINTSEISMASVIDAYKVGVNAQSTAVKLYKSAMETGLALLIGVETKTQLNTAFNAMTKFDHSLSSKSELFDAFKEKAEQIGCYFDRPSRSFISFDEAKFEEGETTAPAEETADEDVQPATQE